MFVVARSKVFKAMFTAEMKEGKSGRVELDVDMEAFKEALRYVIQLFAFPVTNSSLSHRYIYTGSCNSSIFESKIYELMDVANKVSIPCYFVQAV